ncbi:MAG: UDP-3-O-[3-hydroxymyristoyl] N-acetylglucosamine deacetylase [Spirochaetes bacterium]|nr:UDP-3-O-[3-hydroxymyristoyl] N-acetylglucosamine deacetylase [Spirochaetota bacterium]
MNNQNIYNRKTIEDVICSEGIGIHSGKITKLRLLPADLNTGIVFIQKKFGMKSPIKVSPDSVVDTNYAITLSNDKWRISTVEHLLSFFYIFGITDIIVEADGNEIPIYDGSINPIINIFNEKKFYTYEEINNPIYILNPIWIFNEDKYIIVLPSDELKVSYTINYDNPVIKTQYAQFVLSKDIFIKEIAPARTFGFIKDIGYLHKNSLGLGGSLQNTLLISDDSYLNDPRFQDECVRHKILDFIGDISLLGRPIIGHFIVCKSGHSLNLGFIKKIKEIYSSIEIGNKIEFIKKASNTI